MKLMIRMLKKQSGQALPMALILLFIGAILIIPTLDLATVNLKATDAIGQKTREAYAADAGIEDALWYLQSDERLDIIKAEDPDGEWPLEYNLHELEGTVNQREVAVSIDQAWLLNGLLGLPETEPPEGSTENANEHWIVISAINIDDTSNYIVDISTDEAADEIYVDHIAVWLPPGYSYVDDSIKINGVAIDGDEPLVKNPDDQTSHRGGTALIWDYWGTPFNDLSNIAPPPPEGGVTPAEKFPPSMRLSLNYTSTPFQEAKGFFPWIKLSTGNCIAWDTDSGFYHVESTGVTAEPESSTTIEAYIPRNIKRYVSGDAGASSSIQGDYITIGNSLMTSCWNRYWVGYTRIIEPGPPCNYDCPNNCRGTYFNESSATIDYGAVPMDAQIEKAYLYWTAWWWDNDADKQATLHVNGTPVGTGGTVAADSWYIVRPPNEQGYQYACFVDVSDEVKAITTDVNGTAFTVGDVDAVPADACSSTLWRQATNAGWSMIIIYSSEEAEVHQIYRYDQLAYLWDYDGASVEFTILGFLAPQAGDRDAKLATFIAEGDKHIDPDHMEFKGQHSAYYTYLGDSLTTDPNPWDNVFNSYSTATGFTPSELDGQPEGKISGVDLDTYTEDRNGVSLSSILQAGDTMANVRVRTVGTGSGCDGIMIVYVVFSVRSAAVTAGTEFDVGTMMYQFK